jgi:hypothetical protein
VDYLARRRHAAESITLEDTEICGGGAWKSKSTILSREEPNRQL